MTGARVELRHVKRRYPSSGDVVAGIDLVVESGEFVSLLGPSGCGKSTLLRLIAGLDEPDSGAIEVGVTNLLGENNKGVVRRGFVFQEAHLLPWRNVLDNVALPLEVAGVPRSDARELARPWLDQVGLADALLRFPSQLSGGMKMRASVARALVVKPSLLLLDEPFAALDEMTRNRLQEDLRALWRELRMTVVFVTHSIAEAAFVSDRSILLSSRPAKVIEDVRFDFPEVRGREFRIDERYLRTIGRIGAVGFGETHGAHA